MTMDLMQTCDEIYDLAQKFQGGTQITSPEEAKQAGEEADRFLFLINQAMEMGLTPYEVSQAMQGTMIVLA